MASITLSAFAKINLGLHIKAVRPDGFHDIQTIFQTIDLHDRITFEACRGGFQMRCRQAGVPTDRTNLVWKAARQLWGVAGREGDPRGAVVTIEKRIPMQAGLGGGSSDAAAALLGLRRLWKLKVEPDQLQAVAANLGSDVPYFLVGGTALGLGRGEEVYPLVDLPPLWVVLATPPFGIATSDAYAWWDERRGRVPGWGLTLGWGLTPVMIAGVRPQPRVRPLFPAWLGAVPLANDFEGPVFEHHPVLEQVKAQVQRAGAALAAMSGSGSTVFGVFASRRTAAAAARKLAGFGPPRPDVRLARFRPRQQA